jgi:cell cycle protein kinase DBF2
MTVVVVVVVVTNIPICSLAMEYVPGGDLRIILDDFGCLEDSHAKAYFCEMVMCVHTLHKLGYIHRDLKPANFLIDGDGHLKLGDFGLSKGAEGSSTSSRASVVVSRRLKAYSVVGTPQYMAKETLMGGGYDAYVVVCLFACFLLHICVALLIGGLWVVFCMKC